MREKNKKKESLNMWERRWGGGGGDEREREGDLISFNFLVLTFKVLIA